MDEIKLDLARNAAQERGIANVEFRAGNVNQWSDPAAYDLVYSRFLLQHLSQPREVVKRMWAAVRPGGRLVIEDADFDGLFCWPPNEGFSFYARMYPHVLELRGGDPASGRKLYDYFLDARIPSPQVRLAQGFDSAGDTKMLALATLEATAEPIVAAGLASEDEVRAGSRQPLGVCRRRDDRHRRPARLSGLGRPTERLTVTWAVALPSP